MADAKDADSPFDLFYPANDSMIADSIPPKPDLFVAERLSEPAWIFLAREALPEVAKDASLNFLVESGQFL